MEKIDNDFYPNDLTAYDDALDSRFFDDEEEMIDLDEEESNYDNDAYYNPISDL